jgi:hypothetical protein
MAREVLKSSGSTEVTMSAMTIFYQECPICGRNLRIPAKYFGRLMSCSHCEGEFLAGKEELPAAPPAADADLTASVRELLQPGAFVQPQLGEV